MRRLTVLLVALAAPCLLQAQTTKDLAVLRVLRQSNRSIVDAAIWHRVPVTDNLDLVLAIGTPKEMPWSIERFREHGVVLGPMRTFGIFLEERAEPYRVFAIATASGFDDECFAGVLRATATDTVLSCTGEKSEVYPYRKFVYDVRAKRLVSQFSYERFAMNGAAIRLGRDPGAVVLTGRNSTQQIRVEFVPGRPSEFRLLDVEAYAESSQMVSQRVLARGFGPSAAFSLIQVDALQDDFRGELIVSERLGDREQRYRLPRSSRDGGSAAYPNERIGPWQIEGNNLWFGKTFYAGEGVTGTGGFGYFDTVRREFRLFTPNDVADESISAIFVEPETVWLAPFTRGEYGDRGAGVIRFDRRTEALQGVEIGDAVVRGLVKLGDRTILATDRGITVLHGDEVNHYFVDQTTDGRLRVAPIAR